MPASDTPPPDTGKAPPTAEKDKVPLRDKLKYGSGIFGFQIGNNAVQELAYPIYNILLGMPASLIGLVLTISRFWDAFTDPFMGSVSDNARTRWGRRKPFILLGAVLCTITYASIWVVPEGLGDGPKFVYLLVTALLFFTSFTIFAVPYTSQGFELTPDYHERTRVMAVRAYFAKGAAVIIPWVFAMAHWDIFSSQMSGVRVLGVVVGLLIILSALPTLFVEERFEKVATGQLKMPFWKGVRETLKNKPFLFLVGLTVATQTTVLAIGALGLYVSIYYV
ncbi:MAG: MFS transporter, partial [Oceanipulchritudo sp.]